MKNQINTSEGNVQLIGTDGKMINVHPSHVYAVFNVDTVSFLLIAMPKSSGLAVFTSTAEDLLVNGQSYSFEELKTVIPEEFAEAGAQARCEIVDELPATGKTNTIYLVPKTEGEGYDEYIYLKDEERWELVGDTSIEMENYLLKTDFYTYSAATEVTINALSGAISDEASRAISAESALSDSIDALNLYIDEVSGITDTLDGDIDILEESLAQEASARTHADTVLSGAISSVTEDVAAHTSNTDIHVTAADKTAWADKYTQAEVDGIVSGLNDSIDALSGAVADETARAISAETALHNEIENIDLSDYYTKSETSGATELSTAFAAKLDATAYTPTDLSNYYQKSETSSKTEIEDAISAEATARANADTALSGAVDTALLGYINDAEYVSSAKTINFLNGNTLIAQIDATDFIKDGMVDTVAISGGNLVITFNTDAGKEAIELPLTDIFDPSNYYTKAEVDAVTDAISGVVSGHVSDGDIHVTTGDKATWNAKLDASAISDMATQTWVGQQGYLTQHQDISGKQDVSGMTAYTTTAVTDALSGVVSGHVSDSDIHVTSGDKATWNAKQDPLSAGTGIDITSNVISVTGGTGGKAIEAGRGIAITTGETADTVSFNLPISAGTGTGSLIIGDNGGGTSYASFASGKGAVVFPSRTFYGKNYAIGESSFAHGNGCSADTTCHAEGFKTKCLGGFNSHSEGDNTEARGGNSHSEGDHTLAGAKYEVISCHAEGSYTSAMTNCSHAEGYHTKTTNHSEHSQGRYNSSVSASTTFGDSGNTLFSVGNGTADNARHNAFEIRQNGDIYISSGGTDILLQDHLGGGGSSVTVVQTTGTSTTDVMSQDAVTTSLNNCVTLDAEQTISGRKIFTYSSNNGSGNKAIEFKQTTDSAKVGFIIRNSADTNNEVASFEFRPNTFTIDGVQHPLMYFGHYRNTNTAAAGVPQTVIGFRQYDQLNGSALHYLIPLPEKAKTPFSLTTSFKNFYAPLGFKVNTGGTMVSADETGVVDLSSEFSGLTTTATTDALSGTVTAHTANTDIHVTAQDKTAWNGAVTASSANTTALGGLKLVKISQSDYDGLTTKDSNTLYVIDD